MKGVHMINPEAGHLRSRFRAGIEELGHRWGWHLLLGTILIALGVIVAAYAYYATIASVITFGWVMVFAGITLGILSFTTGEWSGFLLSLFAGILTGITGVMLLRAPLSGAAALTLVIASFLLVSGVFRITSALAMQFPNWGWSFASGIVSIVLGGLLLANWPGVSLWFLGFYLGIDLIAHGAAWSMFAFSERHAVRALHRYEEGRERPAA
jgi:uncharacterized membrane protein HdeD (DUF308 family)